MLLVYILDQRQYKFWENKKNMSLEFVFLRYYLQLEKCMNFELIILLFIASSLYKNIQC